MFFSSVFIKSDNFFLKVKLLQLFRILHSKEQMKPDDSLLDAIEAVIIPSKDRTCPQIEVALAVEAAETLLQIDRNNPKVDAFVFRLIESQNPSSRYFGLRLARQYRIHRDIAIDRCIKTGLHDKECLKTLVSFVNRGNHRSIHRRKEEMVFYMEKENADKQVINTALVTVFSKIVQYAKDDFLIRIYQEVPEICLKVPFDRNIPKEHVMKLFNKIYIAVNSRYFPLTYQLVQAGVRNGEVYSLIFERHLNILVIKRDNDWERNAMVRLLDCMLGFGVFEQNRSILISKYQEVVDEENISETLDLILNTVCLLNARLQYQAVHVVGKHFVYFSISKMKNEIVFQLNPGMQIKRLLSGNAEVSKTCEDVSNDTTTSVYTLQSYDELLVEILISDELYAIKQEI